MILPLITLGPLAITAYSLGMALSALLASVLMMRGLKKAGYPPRVGETFLLFFIPLGLLLARLAYVLIRVNFFISYGEGLAFRLWEGGYSVWGVLLGFLLAGALTARRTGLPLAPLMDYLAPYALLFLALGRGMEGLAGLGFGQEVPPYLAWFPVAVGNEWGEWRYAVFLLEAAAALVFALLVMKTRPGAPGDRLRLGLILFLASQILFETLREDEVLSWGFVKASQLLSAIGLFLTLCWGLFLARVNTWKAPGHLALAAFFLLILGVTGLEFLIDKSDLNINLILGLMALCCLLLALLGLRCATRLRLPGRVNPKKEETA